MNDGAFLSIGSDQKGRYETLDQIKDERFSKKKNHRTSSVAKQKEERLNLATDSDDEDEWGDLLNEIADGEFDDLDHEVLDLLARVGLDAEFQMVNYDSDAASDLLTVTAKPKPKDKAHHGMTNMKAAEKYEKMMKERQRREKELRTKQQLYNMFNGSKLYKSTQRGDSVTNNSQISLRRSSV